MWEGLAYICYVLRQAGSGEKAELHILQVIDGIVNNKYMPVYRFFFSLFAVYLSIPLLAEVREKKKMFRYAAGLGSVFTGIMPLLFKLLGITYNTSLTPPVAGGYLVFVLLGYVLGKGEQDKKERRIIYALGAAGWLTHFWGTLYLSESEIDKTFKGYTNIPAILFGCAVFVFVKYHAPKGEGVFGRAINWLAKRSFGVYLIHIYVMKVLELALGIDTAGLLWRTAGTVAVYAASVTAVFFMQKIPGIRKLVP